LNQFKQIQRDAKAFETADAVDGDGENESEERLNSDGLISNSPTPTHDAKDLPKS
jgi:hypothetical protein